MTQGLLVLVHAAQRLGNCEDGQPICNNCVYARPVKMNVERLGFTYQSEHMLKKTNRFDVMGVKSVC